MINAFSMKLWWKVRSQESLRTIYMRKKYFKLIPAHLLSIKQESSRAWKRILTGRDMGEPLVRLHLSAGDFDVASVCFSATGPLLTEIGRKSIRELWRDGDWDVGK
ncbi:uncharacterized protein M6B38_353670 [Iris pallida]|uniref:Uncharacterized protein n=1 Tax=Iris pallida TaxID=29817 RepID=A0AAX6GNI0_IRIPA|nr:uncharacterized protein M6B38_353670 [Iris pallida]